MVSEARLRADDVTLDWSAFMGVRNTENTVVNVGGQNYEIKYS